MKLKDIFSVQGSPKIHAEYKIIYNNLKEKYNEPSRYGGYNFPREKMFSNLRCNNGYARNTYMGKINDGYEMTELELSMILDQGFSHFGGSSTIYSDRTFKVEIYTD